MTEPAPPKKISKPRAVVLFSLAEGAPRLRFAQPPPPDESAPTKGQPLHVPPTDQKCPQAAHAVAHALAGQGFAVSVVNVEDDIDRLLAMIAVERPDVVFNMTSELEGSSMLNHLVPNVLDFLGYPYTGSDPLCLGTCQNRVRSRLLLRDSSVSVPRFATVRDVNAVPETEAFRLPYIVTQAFDDLYETEGSTNPVWDWDELIERVARLATQFDLPFLVEEYISYRRVHVVVIGNRTLECLPITETELAPVPPRPEPSEEPAEEEAEAGEPEAEEAAEAPEEPTDPGMALPEAAEAEAASGPEPTPLELDQIYLAQLDEETADRIRVLARKAFRALGCRDYARIDFHLDEEGQPYVVDVRPLFELGPGYSFALAAGATDRGYDGTVGEIARIACRRAGMPEAALISEQIEAAEAAPAPLPPPEVPPTEEEAAQEESDEEPDEELDEDEEVDEDEELDEDEEDEELDEDEEDEELDEDEEVDEDEEDDPLEEDDDLEIPEGEEAEGEGAEGEEPEDEEPEADAS